MKTIDIVLLEGAEENVAPSVNEGSLYGPPIGHLIFPIELDSYFLKVEGELCS